MKAVREISRPVGIGELIVTQRREEVLVAHSLGSCLGVALFDPAHGVAGLLHAQLPQASLDPDKARRRPGMFVDSGVAMLLRVMDELGARRGSIIVKAAGGAAVFDDRGLFRIGERNFTMLRKALWMNELLLAAGDVGGTRPRTMALSAATGRVVVRCAGEEVEL